MYGEYVDEDLPLPSFREVFAFALRPPISSNAIQNRKRVYSKANHLPLIGGGMMGGGEGENGDSKGAKSKKQKDSNMEESTGRWSAEEHTLFLQGIMLYGKDWKKMQPLIKTRSLVQIRTHAQKVFKKIGLKKFESNENMKQFQEYFQKQHRHNGNGGFRDHSSPREKTSLLQNVGTLQTSTSMSKDVPSSSSKGIVNAQPNGSSVLTAAQILNSNSNSNGQGNGSSASNQVQINYSVFHPNTSLSTIPDSAPPNKPLSGMQQSMSSRDHVNNVNTSNSQQTGNMSGQVSNSISSFLTSSSSHYSPQERSLSNGKADNVPPSPLPTDYLQMFQGTPVSEEDLRLLQQLSEMKETFLNDDEDENPDDDEEMEGGDDENRIYSKSLSYDSMDKNDDYGSHSLHSNQNLGSFMNHHSQHQQYSSIQNYSPHLYPPQDQSNGNISMSSRGLTIGGQPLPSYSSSHNSNNTAGATTWNPADFLNAETNHLSNSNLNTTQILNYSHLPMNSVGHLSYDGNSYFTQPLNSSQHNLYQNSALPDHRNGNDSVESANYLISSLHSHNGTGSFDGQDHQLHANFLQSIQQFLTNNNSKDDGPDTSLDYQKISRDGNDLEEDGLDDDDDMRGDDNDPIIALANRYSSMIPPPDNDNSKNSHHLRTLTLHSSNYAK